MCGYTLAKPLNELLQYLSILSMDTRKIQRVTCHVEGLQAEDLYVAIALSDQKGIDTIALAKSSGCVIVANHASADYLVSDEKEAYGVLLHAFYDMPSDDLCMIAVTGTNGKTTISTYLYQMYRHLRQSVLLIGTNGIYIDGFIEETINTTPSQEVLLKWILYAKEHQIRYVIMEASSIGIDQKRLAGLRFDYVIMSNVTKDHLDYHGTMNRYLSAKYQLFQYLKLDGVAILNTSDEVLRLWYTQRNSKDLFYNEHLIEILEQKLDHSLFIFQEFLIRTNQISICNIYNMCACILVLKHQKYHHNEITNVCKEIETVQGRYQLVAKQPDIYVDFAHTPDALVQLLQFFKHKTKGTLILVFGCGGNRDHSKRSQMGKIACQYADLVIVTEDNSRNEDAFEIIKEICKGCDGSEIVIANRREAIKYAITNAKISDIIIVAGKGNEQVLHKGESVVQQMDEQVILEVVKGRI